MGFFDFLTPDVDVPDVNYGQDLDDYLGSITRALPGVLGSEKRFRDDFSGLNLSDVTNFLGGRKGQPGITDILGKSVRQSNNILDKARDRDIYDMRGDAGKTRNLLNRISPEAAAQVRAATEQAAVARQNAQGLTGQEARDAQQFAREGSADRGRVMDNSSIFSEGLNRDSLLTAKRAEASQMTNNAYGLADSFYSKPGMEVLSRTPQSYQAGQGILNIGLSSIGQNTPKLFDLGAGLNLGAANRQNQLSANAANAQGQSSLWGSLLGGLSSIGSSFL